jgi:hypothetical protein
VEALQLLERPLAPDLQLADDRLNLRSPPLPFLNDPLCLGAGASSLRRASSSAFSRTFAACSSAARRASDDAASGLATQVRALLLGLAEHLFGLPRQARTTRRLTADRGADVRHAHSLLLPTDPRVCRQH